jgi:hypothetical protein
MPTFNRDPVMGRQCIESMPLEVREEVASHPNGAEAFDLQRLPTGGRKFVPDEGPIEGGIVRCEDPTVELGGYEPGHLLKGGCRGHHPIADPREALNDQGNRSPRIYEGAEDCSDLPTIHMNDGDLGDPVAIGEAAPRRLDIDHSKAHFVEGNQFGYGIVDHHPTSTRAAQRA